MNFKRNWKVFVTLSPIDNSMTWLFAIDWLKSDGLTSFSALNIKELDKKIIYVQLYEYKNEEAINMNRITSS